MNSLVFIQHFPFNKQFQFLDRSLGTFLKRDADQLFEGAHARFYLVQLEGEGELGRCVEVSEFVYGTVWRGNAFEADPLERDEFHDLKSRFRFVALINPYLTCLIAKPYRPRR